MFKVGDLIRIKAGEEKNVFETSRGLKVGKVTWVGDEWFRYEVVSHIIDTEVGAVKLGLISNYEKIHDDKIIIYTQGSKVVAKNVATGETAVAKCHPDDEFDFSVGARLALDRLCGETNVEEELISKSLDDIEREFNEMKPKETNLQHYLAEILNTIGRCTIHKKRTGDNVCLGSRKCEECRNENLKWLKEDYKGE